MSTTIPIPESVMKHAAQYVVTRHPSTRSAFVALSQTMSALQNMRQAVPSAYQELVRLDMALHAAVLDALGIPKDVHSTFAEDASAMIFDAEDSIG